MLAARGENTQVSPDTGGDTDPATDIEEPAVAGMKRKTARPVGPVRKCVSILSRLILVLIVHSQVEAVTSNRSIRIVLDGTLQCYWTR